MSKGKPKKHSKPAKPSKGKGRPVRKRKPRKLATEKYLHDGPTSRTWNKCVSLELRKGEPPRYYDISGWATKLDRLVGLYSGQGVPDNLLHMRARAAIQKTVIDHIHHRNPGLIAWQVVKREIVRKLEDEFKERSQEAERKKKRGSEVKAANWLRYLRRKLPSLTKSRKIAEEYEERRDRLVDKNKPRKTFSHSFTHRKQNVMPIRIGLDFGTSSIKAAYRTEDEQTDRTIPLPIGTGKGIDRYIANPALRIEGNSFRFITERTIDDLSWKRCLSCRSGGDLVCNAGLERCPLKKAINHIPELRDMHILDAVLFCASIYLGYALKHVDAILTKDLKKNFGAEEYRCFIHMCVPIGDLEKGSCRLAFQDALTLADQMFGLNAFADGSGDIASLLVHWNECRKLPVMLEDSSKRRSRVFPEVYAEMASYAKSKVAKPGTYILIDIGAGTVDVNVFKWVRANRTSVWSAYCDGTGVLALQEQIIDLLADYKDQAIESCRQQMEVCEFPDMNKLSRLSAGRQERAELQKTLTDAYEQFCSKLATRSKQTWSAAWHKRGIGAWNQLGIFIGGGGSALKGLGDRLLEGIDNSILNSISVEPLPLPDKDDFEKPRAMPAREFHRVSVAYGLTVANEFDGPTTHPKDVKPIPVSPDPTDYTDRYPGAEVT